MLLDRDGSLPRLAFASAPPLRTIQWSPDGTQIAGYAPSEDALMVLNRSSNDIVLLGENSGELYAWSPDSHKIALIRIRVLAEVATYQLLLADLQLGEVRALLPISANPITSLDWHPDGKSLAFSQFTLPETGGLAGRQIHLLTIATLAQRQLTTAADSTFGALSFSSNGERILTVRNRLTTPPLPPSVWMVNAATGELSFVADRATQPRWKRAQ